MFELTYDHSSSMAGFLVDRHCLVCKKLINHGGLICVVPVGNFSGPVVCPGCIPGFNSSLEDEIKTRQADDPTVQILKTLRGERSPFPSQDDLAAAEVINKEAVIKMVWKLVDNAVALLLPALKDDDLLNRLAMGLLPSDSLVNLLWLAMAEDFVSCYYAANNLDESALVPTIDRRTAIKDFLVDRVGCWWYSQKASAA